MAHYAFDNSWREARRGNAYLRYYLCEAANLVRLHDEEYAAYYEKKYRELPKHQHKRAITLTARKLVRLVVQLLTTNQPYQRGKRASEETPTSRYRSPARRQHQG